MTKKHKKKKNINNEISTETSSSNKVYYGHGKNLCMKDHLKLWYNSYVGKFNIQYKNQNLRNNLGQSQYTRYK